MRKSPGREMIVTAAATAGFLLLLGLTTNTVDTRKFSWDFRFYLDMARRGVAHGGLVAPFAYRFLWTELAGALHRATGISLAGSFASIAYAGVFGELLLLDLFLRRWGIARAPARWAVALTALAYCNARFLLSDVYRPEALAYPLLVLAMLALVSGRIAWCVVISLVGLQVREFLLVPLVLAAGAAAWPRLAGRPGEVPRRGLAAAIAALTLLALVLPRLFLPVEWSAQSLDVQHNARAWRGLVGYPLVWARDVNLLFCLLSYGLPVWILLARKRARRVRQDLGARAGLLAAYSVLTLVLTLYGGTDVFRFVAYLFIPQAVVLGLLAGRAHRAELLYALLATALFNRVLEPVPMSDLAHYLDFYGGWNDRLSPATLARTLEALAWILGAIGLRAGLARMKKRAGPEGPTRLDARLRSD